MSKLLTPQQIQKRALAKGLSVVAMCRLADIAPSTFHRWASNDTSPSIAIYQKLVDITARDAAPQHGDGK